MKKISLIYLALLLSLVLTGVAAAVAPVTDGLILQLEANAISGLADGDSIAVWPASVGSDAVATGPTPVVYKSNLINGLPVVRFDGNGGYVNFDPIDDIRTVFWVVKEDADVNKIDQGQWRHLLDDDDTSHFHRGTVAQSTDDYCAIISDTWGGSIGSGEGADRIRNGIVQINAVTVDPLTTSVPRDLSILFVQSSNVVSASNFSYDVGQSVLRSWDGDLAELLIYNRVLTAEEIRNIGGYLTAKYGLTTSYESWTPVTQTAPADGAMDVPLNVLLEWTPPAGTTSQTIYLAQEPNLIMLPVATLSGSANSFDPEIKSNSTYYWQVANYVGSTSDPNNLFLSPVWTFTTLNAIPVFDPPYGQQPPAMTAVLEGQTVQLTAMAGVSPGADTEIDYQWYKNDTLLDGETNSSLIITDVSAADNGSYVCKATNNAGTAHSDPAVLKAIVLIGHWPFDGNYNDVVNGNTGTGIGSPVFVEGIAGQAVKFNGLGDQAATLPTAAMGTDTNFTLMFWELQPENAPANNQYMCASGSPSGHERLYMWAWRNPDYDCDYYGNLYVNYGGNWGAIPSLNQYARGQWHFHALTFNAETMNWHWYIDGIDKGYRTLTSFPGLDTLIHLGNRTNMQRPFTGAIDDFRLYNHELPREAIAAIYAEISGKSVCLDPISGDLNDDCKVNLEDIALLALDWLACNKVPETACSE